MDDLDFEKHLAFFQRCHHGKEMPIEDTYPFVVRSAQETHALVVMDKFRDTLFDISNLSYDVKYRESMTYLRFGAGRRFLMMWEAYRSIVNIIPPDREDPLELGETGELNRDLNVIYMNVRGVLDNLAWAALFEFDNKNAEELNKNNKKAVGIFQPCILKNNIFLSIRSEIADHKDWSKEVKDRRDPVAHRIPLAVPPSFLSGDEKDAFTSLQDKYYTASGNLDFERANNLMKRLNEFGTFVPVFVHNPEDGLIGLYPTLPNDLVHIIHISNTIVNYFRGQV